MVHSSLCCNWFSWHYWWDVVSDHWSNGNYTRDLRRVFRMKERSVYLREASPSRINQILRHTLSPLLLLAPRRWLSPPSSDFSCPHGFQFGRVEVFPADHMHACSRIHHKLSFLVFYCGCGQHNSLLSRWQNVTLSSLFERMDLLGKFSTRLRGRIALVFRSLPEIGPQISRRGDCADENFRLVFYSAMDLCILGCLLDIAQLSWIVLVELVPKLVCPSLRSIQILAAQRPVTRNPTVALSFQQLLHFCHHPSSAFFFGCSSTFQCGNENSAPNLQPDSDF